MGISNHLLHKWTAGYRPDLPTIEGAEDEFLVTADGDRIVDAAAGAAVVNLGHSLDGVVEAAADQMDSVSFLSLSHFSHEAPSQLAERLTSLAPGDLDAAFLVNSGSEANEMAFKLARAYHHRRGNTDKRAIIGRWQSYHGSTLGALSASGNTSRRAPYEPMLLQWPHISPAYPYRWQYEGSPEEQAVAAAGELETLLCQLGSDNIAAFVAEPVSGSSIPAAHPHPAYYREIRRICNENDVLFIADEVMTGFGRTGPMFAIERSDVVPDMLVLGKGISSGYTPVSATVIREDIAAMFDTETGAPFNHGHTFGGNPLSAAIAAHVVDQYTDDVLAGATAAGERLADELVSLQDHPMVGEFRRAGLMIGIEFVADRDTKEPFDPERKVYERVYESALERGVYTYPGRGSVDGVAGDHLMLTPPLTVSQEGVEIIGESVREAVDDVYKELQTSVSTT